MRSLENSSLNLLYEIFLSPNNILLSDIKADEESEEYEGFDARINNFKIKFRTSKITPTKIGQFVTFYKRSPLGSIEPFNVSDDFDYYCVISKTNKNFGVFIFPKECLAKNKILTVGSTEGKRAFRVYPCWDTTVAPQAKKTQQWQIKYFIDLSDKNKIDKTFFESLGW